MESVAGATKLSHRILFIPTEGDDEEIAELSRAGAEFLVHPYPAGAGNFARKINWAFAQVDSEYAFQAADDITFSPKWDTHAVSIAERTGAGIVGTNDLHNAAVRQRKHSTHTLIARSYIEEYGSGTVDGTGLVFCELYDHQYTDTELVETARLRGKWAFSPNSIVEHFHPHWGNAEDDETYKKGQRKTVEDRRLFASRFRRIRTLEARARRGRPM